MAEHSYITIEELITRFGHKEVLHGNDPTQSGEIDAEMLGARIRDVEAEIDFYLAQNPDYKKRIAASKLDGLLVKIAADLVRVSYFQSHPPDAVVEAAKRAHTILDAIAENTWLALGEPQQMVIAKKKEG